MMTNENNSRHRTNYNIKFVDSMSSDVRHFGLSLVAACSLRFNTDNSHDCDRHYVGAVT